MYQKAGNENAGKPTTAKPGTKACAEYNAGKCNTQANHPAHLHIWTYCLSAAHRQCAHQEHFSHMKIYDKEEKNDEAAKN